MSAMFANGEDFEEWKRYGVTPWTIADVARTALAWGGPGRHRADLDTLLRLCSLNAQLVDEDRRFLAGGDADEQSPEFIDAAQEQLARILARIFFEQFPGQRSVLAGVARSVLLFGSAAEFPEGFAPKVMTSGWFERLTDGLAFDDYIESIFLFSVLAQKGNGLVSLDVLDAPGVRALSEVFPLVAARRVFTEHLLTTVADFKNTNREWQDPLPTSQKKFAFNPLTNRPFVEGVASQSAAPWTQAVIQKALPPSIYFLPPTELRNAFASDLGPVFQHYTGRQLNLIDGERHVLSEVRYKSDGNPIDSCDWLLDLPDVLVLIECKARQPIESLRVGRDDWMGSIEDSIGKGIFQLNRSNRHIDLIGKRLPVIDTSKPRVGLVVTLEPFYLNQHWLIREHMTNQAEYPIGVLSVGELEELVLLHAVHLGRALLEASAQAHDNVMLLAPALTEAEGRENPLLVDTWDSLRLFRAIEGAAEDFGLPPENS
ncbi:hypothetical protein [Plantibacter sp. CFBP 8775]|uniref:hypothetical protein n=1 Tax=Plantibacter sp. CFBP 8775 TaxID=2774038 RepID=UPI00178040F4|nr:hypothetical protein [Plantibacter sp. CFBP 8775]MBD8102283.1 hypothetical protein [Plantibacter sp. CFBP 8775]